MIKKSAAVVALACLLVNVCSCSRHADSGGAGEAPRARGESQRATALPSEDFAGGWSVALTNFTGTSLRAVYLSPSDSQGWQENVLGGDELADGATVDIRFSREERAALWDLRIEAVDGHFAEWKSLNLREISRITLLLKLAGEMTVVAEVE